jgi:hypothetical protein
LFAAAWRAGVRWATSLSRGRSERSIAAGLVNDLQQQLQAATAVAGSTEAQFLEFGHLVRQLAVESDRLVEKSRRLIEIALGRDGGDAALAETVELLRGALEAETWNQQLTASLISQLTESGGRMKDVRLVEDGLSEVMGVMRVVGVMIRTESARMPDDVRGLFLDLSVQIVALESEVRDSFGAKFRAVEETRATLGEAIRGIEHEARERSDKADRTRVALQKSLDALSGQIAYNRSREVDLLGMSRRLSEEAAQIVMSLQTHDIISQKLAHVGQALELVRSDIEGNPADSSRSLLARVHEFCRVEAAQLGGVAHDFRLAIATVETATRGILAQVPSGDEDSGLLGNFSEATSSSAEMVQVLLDALAELRHMIGVAAVGAKVSRETVGPIVDALSGLNQAMTDVALKVGLVALNAQVQAVQRGDGTGLEVLAARAAQISKQAEAFGDRVSAAADEVAQSIAVVAAGFEEAEVRMQDETRTLDADGGQHEQRLHSMRDQMLECLQELGDATDLVRSYAEGLNRIKGVWSDPLEQIESAQRALLEAAEAAERAARKPLGDEVSSDRLEWMHRRYTMSSERHAHREALVGSAPAQVPASVQQECEVELF